MLHFLGRYHLLDIKFHIQWRIFLFFSLAKAQRRKEIVVRSVLLSAAADFAALRALFFFFLALRAADSFLLAKTQRNSGPLLQKDA